jgi:hypothetical protein
LSVNVDVGGGDLVDSGLGIPAALGSATLTLGCELPDADCDKESDSEYPKGDD